MKKIECITIIIIISTILNFCIETPYAPKSSQDSREKGLLLATYKPSQDTVYVNDSKYFIEDAWCSYYFKVDPPDEINKIIYAFLLKLKDEEGICNAFPLTQYVTYQSPVYGSSSYFEIAFNSEVMAMVFNTADKPIPPDTIRIRFNNMIRLDQEVFFIKEKENE